MNAAFLDYWAGIRRRLDKEFGQWVPELFGDLPAPVDVPERVLA